MNGLYPTIKPVAVQRMQERRNAKINFYAPIQLNEKLSEANSDHFLVHGTAINVTTTRNNVKYLTEELQKGTPSLIGKPILLDHRREVMNIRGRVTNAFFADEGVQYEAFVSDPQIARMIEQGLINQVSIGATVELLTKEGEGEGAIMVARGIHFEELSFVPVPGDPGASVAASLAEAFKEDENMKDIKEEPAAGQPPQAPAAPAPAQDAGAQVLALLQSIDASLKQLAAGSSPKEAEEPEEPAEEEFPTGNMKNPATGDANKGRDDAPLPGFPPHKDQGPQTEAVALKAENDLLRKQLAESMQKSRATAQPAEVKTSEMDGLNLVVENYGTGVSFMDPNAFRPKKN